MKNKNDSKENNEYLTFTEIIGPFLFLLEFVIMYILVDKHISSLLCEYIFGIVMCITFIFNNLYCYNNLLVKIMNIMFIIFFIYGNFFLSFFDAIMVLLDLAVAVLFCLIIMTRKYYIKKTLNLKDKSHYNKQRFLLFVLFSIIVIIMSFFIK